jgi:hypothetical protein
VRDVDFDDEIDFVFAPVLCDDGAQLPVLVVGAFYRDGLGRVHTLSVHLTFAEINATRFNALVHTVVAIIEQLDETVGF